MENLAAISVQQNNVVPVDQRLNGETDAAVSGKHQENEGKSKLAEKIPSEPRSGQRSQLSATSDEYQRGSGRSRRTSNKSSRGKNSRYAGVAAKQVREKPIAGSASGRKSEITQRPARNETSQAAVNQLQGPMVSRVIYTSDRRTRSGGNSTAECLSSSSSSNTAALTVVTG